MGTIRCQYGRVLDESKEISSTSVLLYHGDDLCSDDCTVVIDKELHQNILNGANFTHIFFSTKEQHSQYMREHEDRFRFVSPSTGTIENYIHLIF